MNTTTDTSYIEDLLSAECRCESRHQYVDFCSGDVAYVITDKCRQNPRNVCAETIESPSGGTRMRMLTDLCSCCYRHASECWIIRPI